MGLFHFRIASHSRNKLNADQFCAFPGTGRHIFRPCCSAMALWSPVGAVVLCVYSHPQPKVALFYQFVTHCFAKFLT